MIKCINNCWSSRPSENKNSKIFKCPKYWYPRFAKHYLYNIHCIKIIVIKRTNKFWSSWPTETKQNNNINKNSGCVPSTVILYSWTEIWVTLQYIVSFKLTVLFFCVCFYFCFVYVFFFLLTISRRFIGCSSIFVLSCAWVLFQTNAGFETLLYKELSGPEFYGDCINSEVLSIIPFFSKKIIKIVTRYIKDRCKHLFYA